MNVRLTDLTTLKKFHNFFTAEDINKYYSFQTPLLPFYFDKGKKGLPYYRFSSLQANYEKVKSSKAYLFFRLYSDKIVKISDQLFLDSLSNISDIFKYRKHQGYLFESSFNYFSVKNTFLKDYFPNSNSIKFLDSFLYSQSIFNRFHKKIQLHYSEIDFFISSYLQSSASYKNSWDRSNSLSLIDTRSYSKSFFISSHNNNIVKYFSYFFLGR